MDNKDSKDRVVFSSVDINTSRQPVNPTQMVNDAFYKQAQTIRKENIEGQIPTTNQINVAQQNIINPENLQPNIVQEPVIKKDKHKRKMKKSVKIKIILILIFILIILGFLDIQKNYINNPKVIARNALESLGEEVLSILSLPEKATLIGDDFSIEIEQSTALESDKVNANYLTDTKMLEYYYLLNNLNNTKTTYTLKQDTKNKQFFYNKQTKLNDELIINDKYLIENSTEYYFVKDFFENYINGGNNHYFETIGKNGNAHDNILYLYTFILDSLASNIEDDDFNVTKTTTYLEEKMQDVKKTSFKLNDAKIRKILNGVLKDLKKDKKASKILNGIYADFESVKITADTIFLNEKETLTVDFYTTGFFNEAKKYEVSITGDKNSYGVTYEIDSKKITILENNSVKYYVTYINSHNTVKATIEDKNNKQIGKFEFDNQSTRKQILIDFEDNNYDITIELDSKISDKKNSSYKKDTSITINIKQDKVNFLNGTITFHSSINKKVTINEQINDVVFEREITEEKQEELKELLKTRLRKQLNS